MLVARQVIPQFLIEVASSRQPPSACWQHWRIQMIKIAKAYTQGFDRAIRRAEKNNVEIVPFDSVLETDKVMRVNENQLDMGCMYAPMS